MNSSVDKFLKKSKHWQKETVALRKILLQTKLEENFKWNLPCYTHNGNNIVIVQPFKSSLRLMFFKGSLLKDSKNLLIANGPNSNAPKRLEFASVQDVTRMKAAIKAYVKEAIAVEDSGLKVKTKKSVQPLPTELKNVFSKNSRLKKSFEALTPGRQRAYILHFSSAKQSATREARIQKCIPRILDGKGLMDR